MGTLKNDIRSGIVIGISFLATVIVGGLACAAIGSSWTSPASLEAFAGSGVSSATFNKLLANDQNLDDRVTAATVPTGTVIAYNGTACPTGWTEAAGVGVPTGAGGNASLNLRGQFVRWWNRTAWGTDASRGFGTWQDMDWKGFWQTNTGQNWNSGYSHNDVYMGKSTSSYVGNLFTGKWENNSAAIGTKWDASEIRPVNVALLYCVKN